MIDVIVIVIVVCIAACGAEALDHANEADQLSVVDEPKDDEIVIHKPKFVTKRPDLRVLLVAHFKDTENPFAKLPHDMFKEIYNRTNLSFSDMYLQFTRAVDAFEKRFATTLALKILGRQVTLFGQIVVKAPCFYIAKHKQNDKCYRLTFVLWHSQSDKLLGHCQYGQRYLGHVYYSVWYAGDNNVCMHNPRSNTIETFFDWYSFQDRIVNLIERYKTLQHKQQIEMFIPKSC